MNKDLDIIYMSWKDMSTASQLFLAVLNKEGCHPDCDGCFEPNNINRCLRCKKGMRLVEGICTLVSIPCPPHMNENAFGECQGCDLNVPTNNNCVKCELSYTNPCIECNSFNDPVNYPLDRPPACFCTMKQIGT